MSASDEAVKNALRTDVAELADDIRASTDMDQVKARLYAAMYQRPPAPQRAADRRGSAMPPAHPQPPMPPEATGERPLSEVRFLTAAETAAVLRVSRMTVYRLVHAGELAAVRVGRGFRIPEQAVHDYLRDAFDHHQVI